MIYLTILFFFWQLHLYEHKIEINFEWNFDVVKLSFCYQKVIILLTSVKVITNDLNTQICLCFYSLNHGVVMWHFFVKVHTFDKGMRTKYFFNNLNLVVRKRMNFLKVKIENKFLHHSENRYVHIRLFSISRQICMKLRYNHRNALTIAFMII